jgi:hypothetical protein
MLAGAEHRRSAAIGHSLDVSATTNEATAARSAAFLLNLSHDCAHLPSSSAPLSALQLQAHLLIDLHVAEDRCSANGHQVVMPSG